MKRLRQAWVEEWDCDPLGAILVAAWIIALVAAAFALVSLAVVLGVEGVLA